VRHWAIAMRAEIAWSPGIEGDFRDGNDEQAATGLPRFLSRSIQRAPRRLFVVEANNDRFTHSGTIADRKPARPSGEDWAMIALTSTQFPRSEDRRDIDSDSGARLTPSSSILPASLEIAASPYRSSWLELHRLRAESEPRRLHRRWL
jgi:hypothetical protein